jgi:hypothetical protein
MIEVAVDFLDRLDHGPMRLVIAVRHVQAGDIHASASHLPKSLFTGAHWAQSADNLGVAKIAAGGLIGH